MKALILEEVNRAGYVLFVTQVLRLVFSRVFPLLN